MLGQDIISCGATRLGASAPTQRIPSYADFVNGESAPSPILALRLSVRPRKSIQTCILYRNPTACDSLLRSDSTYYSFSSVCLSFISYSLLPCQPFFFISQGISQGNRLISSQPQRDMQIIKSPDLSICTTHLTKSDFIEDFSTLFELAH